LVYFLISTGPQHFITPVPPLVTMNSEPHLVQRYLLPTSFAIPYLLSNWKTYSKLKLILALIIGTIGLAVKVKELSGRWISRRFKILYNLTKGPQFGLNEFVKLAHIVYILLAIILVVSMALTFWRPNF